MKTLPLSLLLLALIGGHLVSAQSVGIGTPAPHASAQLDISSTSKGLLVPRMTEVQKGQIPNPATGLLIWQTDGTRGFYYNGGTPASPQWHLLSTEGEHFWRLGGNAGTNMANHYIGTADAQGLRFRVRNTWAGQLDSGKATLFGYKAGWQTTHVSTAAFGTEALAAPSDEIGNAAFGYQAAFKTRSGGYNTAAGFQSLFENISGRANVAVGASSMLFNVSGSRNTALGAGALAESDTADGNTAVGYLALQANKADRNTAIGHNAMAANTSGFHNTAVGDASLQSNIVGAQNTAIGRAAMSSNTTGNENTAVGQSALFANTEGYNNTAIGDAALFSNTVGLGNTAIGRWALRSNTIASENVAVGNYSLSNATTLGGNTAVGHRALELNTAEGNTAMGHDAAVNTSTGTGIAALGFDALRANTTGYNNTAIGWGAGKIITTGYNNTLIGYNATVGTSTRFNATAIGARAYADCNNCVILGSVSGVNNATATARVGIGTTNPTGLLTLNSKTGAANIQFQIDDSIRGSLFAGGGGFYDMILSTAPTNETGRVRFTAGPTQLTLSPLGTVTIGPSAMVGPYTLLVSDAQKDPMIQFQRGATDKGFVQIVNDDIKIGTNADNNFGNFIVRTNGSDRLRVDPNGNMGIGTTNPSVRLQVGNSGDGTVARANAWQTFSDERLKADIASIPDALAKINQLGGYYYYWKSGDDRSRQAGLLAQEVEKVLPEIVAADGAGYKSVDYGKMSALLIEAIKAQQKEIDELKTQLEKMGKRK